MLRVFGICGRDVGIRPFHYQPERSIYELGETVRTHGDYHCIQGLFSEGGLFDLLRLEERPLAHSPTPNNMGLVHVSVPRFLLSLNSSLISVDALILLVLSSAQPPDPILEVCT